MTAFDAAGTLTDERAANLAENPFAGQGPVLLDIGGDIGAIVLRLPPSLHGAEIEIHAVGAASGHDHGHGHGPQDHHHDQGHADHTHHHPHVAVVERPLADGTVFTAVFPAVTAGTYDLREAGGAGTLRVEVTGGSVTEADWPSA